MQEGRSWSIKETSELTGLTRDTIRYYEKIGLLPQALRKKNQHRMYNVEDITKMKLVTCLKKTGISLEDMKPFLQLSNGDEITKFPVLLNMVQVHKRKIEEQIAELQWITEFIDSEMFLRGSFEKKYNTYKSGHSNTIQ